MRPWETSNLAKAVSDPEAVFGRCFSEAAATFAVACVVSRPPATYTCNTRRRKQSRWSPQSVRKASTRSIVRVCSKSRARRPLSRRHRRLRFTALPSQQDEAPALSDVEGPSRTALPSLAALSGGVVRNDRRSRVPSRSPYLISTRGLIVRAGAQRVPLPWHRDAVVVDVATAKARTTHRQQQCTACSAAPLQAAPRVQHGLAPPLRRWSLGAAAPPRSPG